MTVANRITLFRVALVPVFIWVALTGHPYVAFSVFLFAALTDILDGFLARKLKQVSNFGAFIDPLADKLMVMAALLVLIAEGTVGALPVIIVLTREFIVTSLRLVAVEQGKIIPAGYAGKIKIIVQTAAIAYLIAPVARAWGADGIAVWVMAAVTVWSGVDYVWRHRDVLTRASSAK